MSVQDSAIQRAITLLRAAGCEYAIRTKDGIHHGTLQIATPPGRKKGPTVNNYATKYNYLKAVADMQVGDILQWDATPDDYAGLRSAIVSKGIREHGHGSVVSSITHGAQPGDPVKVELMRVS